MALHLPELFLKRMNLFLGEEYEAFLQSYEEPRYAGIRVNMLKIDVDTFRRISPFELRPIPWCESGFYVDETLKPGKHPYYHAGLYYIQEPSAMAPVEVLNVKPGNTVLDLCAAPGGKSTQIAAKLQGEGLLVTNDISADRTKALAKNIELYGVRNAVVLNETPEAISASFPHFFDRILIDAPCSGEGMFRKDEDMARQWETHSVEKCTVMQRDILKCAAALLAPGGRIVYSTCTFSPEENEARIAAFLDENPDFEVIPLPQDQGFSSGRPDWLELLGEKSSISAETVAQTKECGRLWPHLIQGEGHFIAVLQHQGTSGQTERFHQLSSPPPTKEFSRPKNALKGQQRGKVGNNRKEGPVWNEQDVMELWSDFAQASLKVSLQGTPLKFGDNIYQSPLPKRALDGLKTVRPGWYVGSVKNGRFSPGHPLATALHKEESIRTLELSMDGEVIRYLKGETLEIPPERIECQEGIVPKGYVLITADGFSLGWGKWLDGLLKNEYPAGWRWT